jgi:O-antigen/teichoic acid export membrane protein
MASIKTKSEPTMIYKLIGLILVRLTAPATSFLLIILIARMWGQELLGQYVTILVWLTLFLCISLFGLSEFMSREVGARPGKVSLFLSHGLLFVLATSLVCSAAMYGGAVLFRYPDSVRQGMMITALALPFASFILVCQAVFTAFQKIKYIALTSVTENILYLLVGIVIILNDYGLISLIWCFFGVKAVASIFNLIVSHKYVAPLQFEIDLDFIKKLLAPVAAFGIIGIAGQIFMRIDVIMLSKMTDMIVVSLYASASKLTEICLGLPLYFYILNLPVIARGYKSSRETVHGQIEALTGQLFILVTLLCGLVYFFSEPILVLLYGQPFAEAEWMLKILMISFFVMSAETVLAMSCQAAGYHKISMSISVGRAVINVALNYVLIPTYGGIGAALATLLAIISSFFLYQYALRRFVGSIDLIRVIMKPLLVCLSVMFLLYPLSERLNVFLLGFMFLAGYGLIYLAFSGFSIGRLLRLDS